MEKGFKYRYALNSNDELVCISNIKVSGLACNCHCLICNEPLEARIGKGIRTKYFAHSKHSNCHGADMTFIHILSIYLIEKYKSVMASNYYTIPPRKLEFVKVEAEKRKDRNDMQPDVVGITADGKRWAIEIRNTHEVGPEKRRKIIESGIACLEIDVRKQVEDTIETFLFNQSDDRQWINYPYDEDSLSETRAIHGCETPVPDYINNSRKNKAKRNDNFCLKIPDSCHCLADFYTYLNSNNYFNFDGRRHKIIKVDYSKECNQLFIYHTDSSTLSCHYASLVYLDPEGNVLEKTWKCGIDKIEKTLDAIRKDWELKAEELEERESLPFPPRYDNNLPF